MTGHAAEAPMSARTKLALLASLYFSQGLPFGFFTQVLPVLLRKEGFSLTDIGFLSSLIAVPWMLKFLWAPAVDRYWLSSAGRRRSWILPLQLFTALTLAALAVFPSTPPAAILIASVLLLSTLAATQDIATDGLAVDMLTHRERGVANGLQVAGYRVGMIVGGGLLLILHEQLGWPLTFLAMAMLIAFASVPIAWTREPAPSVESVRETPATRHFLRRPGVVRLLFLVVTYKAGEAFATGMLRPFLVDAGLSLADVGWLLGTVGFVAGLVGALLGGNLVNRLGRKEALVWFGLLQAVTVGFYALLAAGKPDPIALYVLCGAEHLAGGMATAALFTCMMDWCGTKTKTSATDYTVQASAVVMATGGAAALSGVSADIFGYVGHFSLATALAFASVIIVFKLFPGPKEAVPLRMSHTPARRSAH